MQSDNRATQPFHRVLEQLLEGQGLKISQLSYKTGLSPTYLSFLKNKPGEYPPTKENIEAIARALNVEPQYFQEYFQYLAQEVIKEKPNVARVVSMNEFGAVKIVGFAPASSLGEAMEQDLGYTPTLVDADFAVYVSGDCLIDAGIYDQDLVFIKKREPKEGDLVLARLNGEVTLKFIQFAGDAVVLSPANINYNPITVSKNSEDFEILGIKVALQRL